MEMKSEQGQSGQYWHVRSVSKDTRDWVKREGAKIGIRNGSVINLVLSLYLLRTMN